MFRLVNHLEWRFILPRILVVLTGLNDSSILAMSIPDCNFSTLFKDNYVQCVERELSQDVYNVLAGTSSFKHRETVNITKVK